MRKIFLAMFGGTPARGELCLYLNAAAGLYQNCGGIQCYPIDKDTESKNYVNTRDIYNLYQDFRGIATETEMASVEVARSEDMFKNMLSDAGIASDNETIWYLMGCGGGLSDQDKRILNICFTEDELGQNMDGGYYGKANIGSVTGDILIQKEIYKRLNLYKDIESGLKRGYELDVVIICSSFGGTGASLGINFGEYLRGQFEKDDNFRMHCIYIQPYFSFPDPADEDERKIDCKQFYAKSATVIDILGQKSNFIKKDDEKAVFDRFYYLGQEVLDQISYKNSAMAGQDNHIHMVDMLVSLAVQDILINKDTSGVQLYGYQYENGGTELLSWVNMPSGINFKTKHVSMMRFCEFMLDGMEPLFAEDFEGYEQEALIIHLYGRRSKIGDRTANITESIKNQLSNDMRKCFEFCRSYVRYWIELEENTRFGNEHTSVTCFFNLDELKRILGSRNDDYLDVRYSADSIRLTQTNAYKNYEKGNRCLDIYSSLCREKSLKGIAGPGKDKMQVAKTFVKVIYEKCKVENYRNQQD